MNRIAQKPTTTHLKLWRWHFYAGIFSMPFMVVLSLSGLVYLFRAEIEDNIYSSRVFVPEFSQKAGSLIQPLREQAISAEDFLQIPETQNYVLKSVLPPKNENRNTQFVFAHTKSNSEHSVFVDPYTAKVVGTIEESSRPSAIALKAHGELFVGTFGDLILELAASWTVLLVGTGIFLWVPSARSLAGMLFPKFRSVGRDFWRSLHGSAGLWISICLLFFCLTGLFWTGVWGAKIVKPWNTFPEVLWNDVPKSEIRAKDLNSSFEKQVPWAIEDAALPKSTEHHSKTSHEMHPPTSKNESQVFHWRNSAVNLDVVQKTANEAGMSAARTISVPKDETGVFSVSAIAQNASEEQMLHLDQHTGKILANVGFDSYPLLAKSVSVSIALHEGRQFGSVNKWIVSFLCLLLLILCFSASVLWWKRRPTWTQLKAPSKVPSHTVPRVPLFAALGAFCLFFPTAGLSLVVVSAFDFLVVREK
jgi:uncharacterized iron-regulated membrane protein